MCSTAQHQIYAHGLRILRRPPRQTTPKHRAQAKPRRHRNTGLDTLTPPFRYEARTPTDIAFAPLGRATVHTAAELMEIYESDKHLSRYLPIIRDSNVYPIIYDAEDHILSMPTQVISCRRPRIIDTTATDDAKLQIVINMVASMFSEYCAEQFTCVSLGLGFDSGS
ncbi:hypothetical protein EV702DRAFT_246498 [Suillus placidus]|uniref:Uncharacterized protein n=1 Tax=Suillus placidus TaxID=48579 RepID=A0A9P7A7N8_9AGAM|nr:hypothetical protein EV702DRAFT_246498 [Suillus placidus]